MSDQTKQNNYWKSLNELAQNKEYQKFAEREFPEDATEMTDQVSRRSFLRVMGASIALAGFASCRKPVQKILPYSRQPENVVVGNPNYYATSMPFQDVVTGLVVENNEGRPSKIEGNTDHPSSRGKTNIYHQAAVLGMYDPDRSRHPRQDNTKISLDDFVSFAADHFEDRQQGILFISEANSSPTYNRLKENVSSEFPNSNWVTYEPFGEDNSLEGTNLAFGQRLRTQNHYDIANLVVSLDDDFMTPSAHKNSVENAQRISERRRVRSTEDTMSRIYSVENSYTNTGSYADHRLRLKSSEIEAFTFALANRLSAGVSGLSAYDNVSNEFSSHEWIDNLAAELLQNRGESIVSIGAEYSPAAHATVAAINSALDNIDNTVTYHQLPYRSEQNEQEAFVNAVSEMNAGQYSTVVFVGTNPAFTAPADLNFTDALTNVGTKIHLSDYYDETSKLCDVHVNRAHFLEAWGDGLSYTGQRSIIQPQILPLFDGSSEIEFLDTIITGERSTGYDLVQQTWNEYYPNNFSNQWNAILHDGIDTESGFENVSVSLQNNFASEIQPELSVESTDGIEINIKPDPTIFDGRFANNGWLQELPDPMTKITWDNVALMSPATAISLGISPERSFSSNEVPTVRIETGDSSIEIAAWIQPGHADNSITLYTGYGRQNIGRVADGVGVNTYPLRVSNSMFY
ncbi:MAG: TAT-variant-translocated molybdopterin oxidoreductase, partial [Balneolaceae bacterium]